MSLANVWLTVVCNWRAWRTERKRRDLTLAEAMRALIRDGRPMAWNAAEVRSHPYEAAIYLRKLEDAVQGLLTAIQSESATDINSVVMEHIEKVYAILQPPSEKPHETQ